MVALLDTAGRVDLELESFEAIPAGDRFLLLRLAGRWVLADGVAAPQPNLLIQRGSERERFAPLPGSDEDWRHADGRDWSAGYAVPSGIVAEPRTRFWLEAEGQTRYPLPLPEHRALLEGERAPEIVVRGGRPYLLVACGLMAAALIPLGKAAPAGAQEQPPVTVATVAQTVATQATVTAPTVEASVPVVETTPAPATGSVEAVKPEAKVQHEIAKHASGPKPKAKKKAAPAPAKKAKTKKQKRRVDDNPSTSSTADASLDPTPHVTKVPSPLLESFHIPPFLLPIYQAAAMEYGLPWQVLAGINEVETDYGRNLNVSSAGALGWMQFMPSTWRMYGVDANLDGKRDPFNPADAIFAAARYLHAAGAKDSLRRAIYAYNHADWYVDLVLSKARQVKALPDGLVDSLTGLTQGRFPVGGAKVTYTHPGEPWPGAGGNVDPVQTEVNIRSAVGHPVLAVADGRVIAMGTSRRGAWLVLEDAYGNRFTYGGLAHLTRKYAAPKPRVVSEAKVRAELHLPKHDGRPHRAATSSKANTHATKAHARIAAKAPEAANTWPKEKERLFAHPTRKAVLPHGGRRQLQADAPPSVLAAAARSLGLKPSEIVLKRLHPGARLVAGTVVGRLGGRSTIEGRAAVAFKVRPAGRKAPRIDPKPLLDGWRLLQTTSVYGPAGTSTLAGNAPRKTMSVGRLMLLGKSEIARRVLADKRITIYEQGRNDIRSGQIDRRVLATLAYLAEVGLHPTVSCLKSGHSLYTTSGNVSEHSTGSAVDIAAINGEVISPATQGPGTITETTIRSLLRLQGGMKPHQIISLMTFAGADNTLAMADHYDHIHVGFRPEGSADKDGKLGKQVAEVLAPGQWSTLMHRLAALRNPRVFRKPSRYALDDREAK